MENDTSLLVMSSVMVLFDLETTTQQKISSFEAGLNQIDHDIADINFCPIHQNEHIVLHAKNVAIVKGVSFSQVLAWQKCLN